MHTILVASETLGQQFKALAISAIWAAMTSAMLVESDIYRYLTIAIIIFAILRHWSETKQSSKDWLALICYAWATYAFVRFAAGVLADKERGTSEWLYIFPALFPLMGVALFASRRHIFRAATLLIACGFILLTATLDFQTLLSGSRAAPLFHNNPIHAAIGSCMLFLTTIFWLLYVAETPALRGPKMWLCLVLGVTTVLLSLFGVLGAQSKGVWLALFATVVFVCLIGMLHYGGKWRIRLLAGTLVGTLAAVSFASPYVLKVAGPTMEATVKLVGDGLANQQPLAAVHKSIADPATPTGMRERLMLWSNSIELSQAAPWIGWGNSWMRERKHTTYADVRHTLIHNGYFEILVRHGLLGWAFLLTFALTSAYRVRRAHRHGIISSSLAMYIYSITFFFFLTVATNSNNRLAIGESFFIIMAGCVFALSLATKVTTTEKPDVKVS